MLLKFPGLFLSAAHLHVCVSGNKSGGDMRERKKDCTTRNIIGPVKEISRAKISIKKQ